MFYTDHLKNTIELTQYPKRIVSLVPSQTELLWDLGLREEIIGITKFCIHPNEMYNSKARVGGTKTLDLEKIRALKPDLIIGNKEENEHQQIIELEKEFKVIISDIYNLIDSYKMIIDIGEIVNRKLESEQLVNSIQNSFSKIKKYNKTVLYLIWNKPYMAAGNATFIGDLLNQMNLINVLENKELRYPVISVDEIKQLNPDLIFLSSEPFPFNQNHINEIQIELPRAKIMLVDGELFSWYGSRLLKSVEYFNSLEL